MTSPAPIAYPTDSYGWLAFVAERPAAAVELVAAVDERLTRTGDDDMDAAARLDLWNDADLALRQATSEVYLLSESHPDAAVRAVAEERVQQRDPVGGAVCSNPPCSRRSPPSTPTRRAQTSTRSSGACSTRCCATSAAAASICPRPNALACAPSPSARPS